MCKRAGNWREQREKLSCCASPKTAYADERMLFRVACHGVKIAGSLHLCLDPSLDVEYVGEGDSL